MVDLHFLFCSETRPTPVPRPRVAHHHPTPSGGTVSSHLEVLQKLRKDRELQKNRELQMERESKTWTTEIEHDPTSNYGEYLKAKEKAWKEKQLR